MSRADREQQQRLQRMLAREQGTAPPDSRQAPGSPAAQATPEGFLAPPRPAGRPGPEQDGLPDAAGDAGDSTVSNARQVDFTPPGERGRNRGRRNPGRPLSPILRRRRQRRRNLVIALVLAALLALAWVTGALNRAMTAAGDLADSFALSFEPGGWPASTGIAQPLQVEALAGGFVELDATDVAVFGSNGALLRTIQPGYARPAISAGNTRFVLYNRATPELRIESRTRTLYTPNLEENILLCAMSANGTVAVVGESSRYAAHVQVYDPAFAQIYEWYATQVDGTPVALSFAADNRRFAAGCISASGGQILTKVFLMDLDADAPTAIYTAASGEMILRLEWLSSSRVLAVFSDSAVLLDAGTGAELARYDFGGASLVDADTAANGVALLLSGQGSATLTVLNAALSPLSAVDAGSAEHLCCTDTQIYLAADNRVQCLSYDGTARWEQTLESPVTALLDAGQPLAFTGGTVTPLSDPSQ